MAIGVTTQSSPDGLLRPSGANTWLHPTSENNSLKL